MHLRLARHLSPAQLLGKVADVVRKRRRKAVLRQMVASGILPHRDDASWTFATNVMPLPSARWLDDYRDEVLVYARRALDHRFDVLGSGIFTSVDATASRSGRLDPEYRPLDWAYDPTSDHHWKNDAWSGSYAAVPGVEIKQPLEFGRLHHLPQLALAALIDPDTDAAARYHREVCAVIEDFVDANPPMRGIQWCSGIDVGIRAFNIAVAWDWVRRAGYVNESVERRVLATLVDHATVLQHTLEWSGGMRTSHYLANLLGILAVGTYVGGHAQSSEWRSFAGAALEREVDVQFMADGSGFEASTCYHRHTADIIDQAMQLLGDAASAHLRERHRRIMERCTMLVDGADVWPMIGDNDDGLALKLVGFTPQMWRIREPAPRTWRMDLGLWSYAVGTMQCTLRCGPIGQHGKGGHAHNDQLSMTLRVDNTPFLVDPGIPSYTRSAEERNLFRSTRMHNTLAPVGREQNAWPDDDGEGLFWMMGDRARARVVSATAQQWSAEHFGFGAPHRREVVFTDEIRCTDTWHGDVPADILFHCHPDVVIEHRPMSVVLRSNEHVIVLAWDAASSSIETYPYAPGYGKRIDAQCIVLRMTGPTCTFTLRSFAG